MTASAYFKKLENYLDNIQAKGSFFFTIEEAAHALSISVAAVQRQVQTLQKKQRIALIRKGFYVIVSPEYRVTGAPPLHYYIEGMMGILKRKYYIGLLNAAAWYGAAHQQPQTYSLIIHPPVLPDINKPYSRIKFVYRNHWEPIDLRQQKTNAGYVWVSSPELTALDLCHYAKHAGGINQVATVLQELVEQIDETNIVATASRYNNITAIQRLGYLLDILGEKEKAALLKKWLLEQKHHSVLLDTENRDHSSKVTGNEWRIIVNTEIDPDL